MCQTDRMLCRKLVIIGDGACGKTSLLSVFTLGYFPTVSTPNRNTVEVRLSYSSDTYRPCLRTTSPTAE